MLKAFLKAGLFVVICLISAYSNLIPGLNKESIAKYYFLDYSGIFLVLTSQIMLKDKDKRAFIIYTVASIINGTMGYILGSMIVFVFSLIATFISINNWIEWRKQEKVS
jgi:hypothetical protein